MRLAKKDLLINKSNIYNSLISRGIINKSDKFIYVNKNTKMLLLGEDNLKQCMSTNIPNESIVWVEHKGESLEETLYILSKIHEDFEFENKHEMRARTAMYLMDNLSAQITKSFSLKNSAEKLQLIAKWTGYKSVVVMENEVRLIRNIDIVMDTRCKNIAKDYIDKFSSGGNSAYLFDRFKKEIKERDSKVYELVIKPTEQSGTILSVIKSTREESNVENKSYFMCEINAKEAVDQMLKIVNIKSSMLDNEKDKTRLLKSIKQYAEEQINAMLK